MPNLKELSDQALDSRVEAIRPRLVEVARRFPEPIERMHFAHIERTLFHLDLLARRETTTGRVVDIGGGLSLFTIGCALLGMEAILVDDFRDPANLRHGGEALDEHRANGVHIEERDVIEEGLGLVAASLDAAVSFDSMEHWHRSPKALFRDVQGALRPGGMFVLGVPNCVNLRKRLTVPLGRGKWSAMADWYEPQHFRGHVREPDVDDLLYIADDMMLSDVEVVGRNWIGSLSPHLATRRATRLADRFLRPFPSLCDLYLIGARSVDGV